MLRTKADFDSSRRRYTSGRELHGLKALSEAGVQARLSADSSDFRAVVWTARYGAVHLTRYRGDALRSVRTEDMLFDAYGSLVQVGLPLSGVAEIEQEGTTFEVAPGGAVLVRQDRPFHIRNSDGYESVQVYVGSRRLRAWGFGDDDLSPGSWALSDAGTVAADFVSGLSLVGERGPGAGDSYLSMAAAHAAMSIIADRRVESVGLAMDGPGAVRLRALTLIDARFAEPNLTTDGIAEALNVSRRFLYRAFEPGGVSIATVLRDRRLECACDLLVDRRQPTMTLTAIAHACGYSTPTSFARAFKARFGCTPREYRERVLH